MVVALMVLLSNLMKTREYFAQRNPVFATAFHTANILSITYFTFWVVPGSSIHVFNSQAGL
jgi:hypothetical protein